MKTLDLFSIGAWAIFDHIYRLASYPGNGDTVTLDMPIDALDNTYYGDCSANVAAAAARLGARAGFGAVVGEDFVTSGYEAHLHRLGVNTSGVTVIAGARSGHNYLYFDASGDGFCISHRGIAAEQDHWQIPRMVVESARGGDQRSVYAVHPAGNPNRTGGWCVDRHQRHDRDCGQGCCQIP